MLNPAHDQFNTIPNISLSFNQFKDFFENAQGCSDLVPLCNEYDSNPEELQKIIKFIHPIVLDKSIKNRLTRIANKLKKIQDLNFRPNSNMDRNEDETLNLSS